MDAPVVGVSIGGIVKNVTLVGSALAAFLTAGCSDAVAPAEELTVKQACVEIREPMLAPSGHGDEDRQGAVRLLRSVADRGDEDVREIFGDAAKAIEDFGDPELDRRDVPQWVDDALGAMVSACGATLEGNSDR